MATKLRHRHTKLSCSKQNRQYSDMPLYWVRRACRTHSMKERKEIERNIISQIEPTTAKTRPLKALRRSPLLACEGGTEITWTTVVFMLEQAVPATAGGLRIPRSVLPTPQVPFWHGRLSVLVSSQAQKPHIRIQARRNKYSDSRKAAWPERAGKSAAAVADGRR